MAVEADVSGDLSLGAEEAEDGERGGRFPGAGFSDQAEGLAGGNLERYYFDGAVRSKGDGEIGDFEER